MPKFKFETQVHIVCATMAIHNFIRRNTQTDDEFSRYEDESILDINDGSVDEHVDLDPSLSLNTISSTEMDHVRDSIRDQLIESMQND